MTTVLIATVFALVGGFAGYQAGHARGRVAERSLWCKLIRALYRNSDGATEFKVEVVAKMQRIERKGWSHA